jgi:hypothetical protein
MCDRYYRRSDEQKIAEAFHVGQVDDFALPRWDYNARNNRADLLKAEVEGANPLFG